MRKKENVPQSTANALITKMIALDDTYTLFKAKVKKK